MKADLTEREIRVARAVACLATPTINRISQAANISRTATVNLLTALERKGVVNKNGNEVSGSGRPSYLYQIRPDHGHFLGVSVKRGNIKIIETDAIGEVINEEDFPYPDNEQRNERLPGILDHLLNSVADVVQRRQNGKPLLCVGVTQPGMVDSARGVWLHGLQVSGIRGVELLKLLREKLSVDIVVEDEVRALTLYEKKLGRGRDTDHLVLLFLGSGVSAGIYENGCLFRGFHGLSGEIGHVIFDEKGEQCLCGNRGCLETMVSTESILSKFHRKLKQGVRSSLQHLYATHDADFVPTLEDIVVAAQANDRLVHSTLFDIGTTLGNACTQIIKSYNPEKLLISGPVSVLRSYLLNPINIILRQKVIPEMLEGLTIEFCDYHPRQEAIGMSLLARDHYWAQSS
jgi:transcriptional regulator of PTS gene